MFWPPPHLMRITLLILMRIPCMWYVATLWLLSRFCPWPWMAFDVTGVHIFELILPVIPCALLSVSQFSWVPNKAEFLTAYWSVKGVCQQRQVFLLSPHEEALAEVPEEDLFSSPEHKGAWARHENTWKVWPAKEIRVLDCSSFQRLQYFDCAPRLV